MNKPHIQYPRTMAFSYHLMLFVKTRWLAVISVVIGILLCQFVVGLSFGYTGLYLVVAAIVLYNVFFYWQLKHSDFHEERYCDSPASNRGRKEARKIAWLQILFDLVALFYMLHFTGGLENPFVIFFMLHMVMATILLEPLGTVVVAVLITGLVFLLGISEKMGWLDHYHQDKVLGAIEPVSSWWFVLGLPAILSAMNLCLTTLTYFMMRAINRRRDMIIDLSEELEQKNERLLRLDNRRKQTMAVVSHDMKSPIDAVTSYLKMMDEGYLGEMTAKQLDIVKKSIERLRRLRDFISDVLDWQTIERGEMQQVMAPLQIDDLLTQVVADHADKAAQKNIEMNLNIEEELPAVSGSVQRLMQVFDNLVSNAVKYTLDNGKVNVDVSVRNGQVHVTVADTGIGMSSEEMAHLFEDFYRSPRVKRSFEGTGLGLSVVHRIVQAHHGVVWATSEPDVGTKFHVMLPVV